MCNKIICGSGINQDEYISRKQLECTYYNGLESIDIMFSDNINSAMNSRLLIIANWFGYSRCLKKWTILDYVFSFSILETSASYPFALTKVVLTTSIACCCICFWLSFCPSLVLSSSKVTLARCLSHNSLLVLIVEPLHLIALMFGNASNLNHIHKSCLVVA